MTPDRQAKQDRAQAAALQDLENQAARQREQTNKLRQLRLEKEQAESLRFKRWREGRSASDET
ncbi:MAG: hypothetical protein R3C58_03530 [Parvularculaceae bacterium]